MQSSISVQHRIARAILMMAMLFAAGISLSACNTTAGAGQDVSAAGRAVTNSADKVKSGL